MYLPVSCSFCPWTGLKATFLKSRLVVDYSFIFAVSELSMNLFQTLMVMVTVMMMVMKTVMTGVC